MDPEQDDGLLHKLQHKFGHKLVRKLNSEQVDGWSQKIGAEISKTIECVTS